MKEKELLNEEAFLTTQLLEMCQLVRRPVSSPHVPPKDKMNGNKSSSPSAESCFNRVSVASDNDGLTVIRMEYGDKRRISVARHRDFIT